MSVSAELPREQPLKATHSVDPVGSCENLPPAQALQTAPEVALYCPLGHPMQPVKSVFDVVPAAHAAQTDDPAVPAKFPGVHAEHEPTSSPGDAEYVPTGQSTQERRSRLAYCPLAQALHAGKHNN